MLKKGSVDILSKEFALGWAESDERAPAHLYAVLSDNVIGSGAARLKRRDLEQLNAGDGLSAKGFIILYDKAIEDADVAKVEVRFSHSQAVIPHAPKVRVDRQPQMRLFILGSPRSGTSELGSTLTKTFGLPWLGEGHAAHLFANAAQSLAGKIDSPIGFVRFMAQQNFRSLAVDTARTAYYAIHSSGSFLDKTPGHPMISAAPFLRDCFPDAKFIFLRRNGVSNVLSRMVKFGGDFREHCLDWAKAMSEWIKVREKLPHFLEIEQEDMLAKPASVAASIASYLGAFDKQDEISESLRSGSMERTGAGIGRTSLSQTGWSEDQKIIFQKVCRPMMEAFSYDLTD